MRCGCRLGKILTDSPRLRLAIERAQRSGCSVGDAADNISEAEARLLLHYRHGEPTDGERLDYWLSNTLASYLSVHRRAGSAPVTAKQLTPDWGWQGKSAAAEQQQIAATAMNLRKFFKAMAEAQKKRRAAAAANPKPTRRK